MARLESTAVGGFYPTPTHIIPQIASVLSVTIPEEREKYYEGKKVLTVLDPCAGEGEALLTLTRNLLCAETLREIPVELNTYACELEESRYLTLREKVSNEVGYGNTKNCLQGDAFRVVFSRVTKYNDTKSGASILYLNPPYDTDRVHGRLEQRFLERFASVLSLDGVLVFVVPFYALKASAEFLSLEFQDVTCFRFPKEDFDAYRQVVLYARKSERSHSPNLSIRDQVMGWANDADSIEEFGRKKLYEVPLSAPYQGGLSEWQIKSVDFTNLLKKCSPWHSSKKAGVLAPIHGVIPDGPVQDTLLRTFPVATPPRPAHIASGIASGLFNGSAIVPNDPSTKLPDLLVKGVFDREFRTIEEKKNKDGDVVGQVQIQQPKLVTTVLDLSTHKYHTLGVNVEASGTTTIEHMNVADLLKYYSDSLMSVMSKQCPTLYDPRRDANSIQLADSPRKPFTAQAHAIKAIIKLLGGPNVNKKERKGKSAILLGEIGSGKTQCALLTGRTIGASKSLVMCPPHLLKSWQDEVTKVLPEATSMVLSSVEALEEAERFKATPGNPLICILSRETGKLAHGWEGVSGSCPKCGSTIPDIDHAKKRSRCESKVLNRKGVLANAAYDIASSLAPFSPTAHSVKMLLTSRFDEKRLKHYENNPKPFNGLPLGTFDAPLWEVLCRMLHTGDIERESAERVVSSLLLADWDTTRIVAVTRLLLSSSDTYKYYAQNLLTLLPPGHPAQEELMTEFTTMGYNSYLGSNSNWGNVRANIKTLANGNDVHYPILISWAGNELRYGPNRVKARSLDACTNAIGLLAHLGSFSRSKECGEHLFGAVPEPRRVSLAKHIVKYHKNLFDFIVLDESHELNNGDTSAQGISGQRLMSLQKPTLLMTGSVMNGYAESLFSNMWGTSPAFRLEFERDDRQRFVDRYGYRKRLIEDKDSDGKVTEFGSNSDRVTRSERVIGNAPGVLPLFVLKHLLPISVTLHKSDLAIDLPECKQEKHVVQPTKEQMDNYKRLQESLVEAIKNDMFDEERAGKLFGQLAELPSYLDRATCDTGNSPEGSFEIRYPESLNSELLTSVPGMSSDTILPKEQWMLDTLEKELAEGRNVMVFTWHTSLLPRISKLIAQHLDLDAPILYADKVPTGKRQDWIDREIVKKKRRVLITNPVCIQTGLNNLVHFASEIWMENPSCNAVTFRQAVGRVDRIGQKKETRIHTAIYDGTLQTTMYDLLMKKVAVSTATDGLDPESAMVAAGLGEDNYLAGLSIGKQLWATLNEG